MATRIGRRSRLRTVSFLSRSRRSHITTTPRSGHRSLSGKAVHVLSAAQPMSERRSFSYSLPFSFLDVYDGRQSYFARSSSYSRTFTGVVADYGAKQVARSSVFPRLYYFNPANVVRCARRAERRRVIFARGSAGGKVKPPKFTQESQISCKM